MAKVNKQFIRGINTPSDAMFGNNFIWADFSVTTDSKMNQI